jgi:integrase
MARKPLSATEVDNAKLKPGLKEQYFLAGEKLYLRLRQGAKGVSRQWLFRYVFMGEQEKFALGSYPEISLADARARAAAAGKLLAQGLDPQAEQERLDDETKTRAILEQQGAIPTTVATLFVRWRDDYLARKHSDGGAYIGGVMERHVLPSIGHVLLADLRARHVVAALDRIRQTSDLTRTCGVALDAIRQMCKYAVPSEWIQGDPTVGLDKARWDGESVERERWLSEAEIKQLAQALALSDMPDRWQHAIWLVLAVGTRAEETVLAEVQHFALDPGGAGGIWTIPAANQKKTRRKTAPKDFEISLSPFARLHVEALIALSPAPADGAHYLFPGRGNGGHANEKTLTHLVEDRQRDTPLKGRKCSNDVKLPGGAWTPHDLRRTASSQMGELGIASEIADLCLNHAIPGKVTRTYQRSPRFGEMMFAWQAWSEQLAKWTTEAEADPVFQSKLAAKIKDDLAREARYAVVKARRIAAKAS